MSLSYGSPAAEPFFGEQTSAVNFCEEDYIITRYAAEFINTVTSIGYIIYGVYGIKRFKSDHSGILDPINLPYYGLITVGCASGLYHATMKYHTQMGDEMSMHFAMGCVLIQIWTWNQPKHIQRRNASIIVIGLTSFIIYHCVTDEFVLHVILFFGLSVSVAWKTRLIIKERLKDPSQREKLGKLSTAATCIALSAYGLWNIDVHFCSTLTSWKLQIGIPWGFLLELHGYWHLLTSISTYMFMAIVEVITGPEHDETHGQGFKWPVQAVLQELVTKQEQTSNGSIHTNGHAKGKPVKKRA